MRKIIKTEGFVDGIEVMLDGDKHSTFVRLDDIKKALSQHETPLLELSYRQHWKNHKSSWHDYGSKAGIYYTVANLHSLLNIIFNEQHCEKVEITLKKIKEK